MRIAVVVPVRNDAEALEACLTALERQTRSADEVVVVDNGSTDGSGRVAARHGALLVRTEVPGIPGATAAGLDRANGDVLVRLDADSVPAVEWLARIDAAFTADPALAALSGAAHFYGGTPTVRFLGRLSLTLGYFRFIAAVIGHMPLYGSNLAIRAEVWRRMRQGVHRDRADVHDDLDLSPQLPPGCVVRYDPDLSVSVSSRSFTRPGGTKGQIGNTARTFLVTSRDVRLERLRLAWYLAIPPSAAPGGPLRRLERGERIVAQRLWSRLLRTVPNWSETPVGGEEAALPEGQRIPVPRRAPDR
ncbi:MAG: glycosyltransferase [Amnibacterium sp.]